MKLFNQYRRRCLAVTAWFSLLTLWFSVDNVASAEKPPKEQINRRLKEALSTRVVARSEIPPNLQELATAILQSEIPDQHEDIDDWGGTKRIWNGVDVKRDGLRVRTHRKWKDVNHGTWKRYRITQINPEENVQVSISDFRELEDGVVAFRIELTSMVNAFARLSEWNRGVRLASTSIDADAFVRLQLECTLETEFDFQKLPPDVVLRPQVQDADIRITKFETNRISKMDGPVAEELGRSLKRILDKQLDEKRPKLVAKMNKQIEKKQDKLRFSMRDFLDAKLKDWNVEKDTETTIQQVP